MTFAATLAPWRSRLLRALSVCPHMTHHRACDTTLQSLLQHNCIMIILIIDFIRTRIRSLQPDRSAGPTLTDEDATAIPRGLVLCVIWNHYQNQNTKISNYQKSCVLRNSLKLVGAINCNLKVLCSLQSCLVNYVNDSLQICQVEFL